MGNSDLKVKPGRLYKHETIMRLEEAAEGRVTLTALLSLCVLCTKPWLLTRGTRNCFDAALAGWCPRGGRLCGLSGQLLTRRLQCQLKITRRQRMSHFTHSWKEQCVSLCHLQLLLSAGAWCVEGKGSERHHGLVWGLLQSCLKSLLGQGLSYLQKKKEKLMGCLWSANCFVSTINGLS